MKLENVPPEIQVHETAAFKVAAMVCAKYYVENLLLFIG